MLQPKATDRAYDRCFRMFWKNWISDLVTKIERSANKGRDSLLAANSANLSQKTSDVALRYSKSN